MEIGVKFFCSKTVVMHFCNNRKFVPELELKLHNTHSKIGKIIKRLGLIF